jgi:hypothetical protein
MFSRFKRRWITSPSAREERELDLTYGVFVSVNGTHVKATIRVVEPKGYPFQVFTLSPCVGAGQDGACLRLGYRERACACAIAR